MKPLVSLSFRPGGWHFLYGSHLPVRDKRKIKCPGSRSTRPYAMGGIPQWSLTAISCEINSCDKGSYYANFFGRVLFCGVAEAKQDRLDSMAVDVESTGSVSFFNDRQEGRAVGATGHEIWVQKHLVRFSEQIFNFVQIAGQDTYISARGGGTSLCRRESKCSRAQCCWS